MHLGGCQCGEIRYQISGAPVDLYVCHCAECRRQSASAFGISVIVKKADFKFTKGNPSVWRRPAHNSGHLDCYFCPTCGVRLCHQPPDPAPMLSVKGGSLDQPPDMTTAHHIWTGSKLDGICIPDGVDQHVADPEP